MGYPRAGSLSLKRACTLRAVRVLPAPVQPVRHQLECFAIVEEGFS